eukprot:NODE_296_length_11478_cov_0.345197.p11 type:complete len:105 gc:universal NODE_296_length_11478_cov_0.345197:4694-5008(+)
MRETHSDKMSYFLRRNPISSCHQIRKFIRNKKGSAVKMTGERKTSRCCLVCEQDDITNIKTEYENGYRLRYCNICSSANQLSYFEKILPVRFYIEKRLNSTLWD